MLVCSMKHMSKRKILAISNLTDVRFERISQTRSLTKDAKSPSVGMKSWTEQRSLQSAFYSHHSAALKCTNY